MSKAAQAQAFIAFLRCEAKASEERAASLRATAATIETNATDGQKKKRKRAEEDSEVSSQGSSAAHPSSKEGISGYMLFYRENFELIKKSQPPGTSERDAIVEVAAQWVGISNEEKLAWKFRAEELNSPAAAAASESDQARGGAKKKGGKKTEIVARNPIDVTV